MCSIPPIIAKCKCFPLILVLIHVTSYLHTYTMKVMKLLHYYQDGGLYACVWLCQCRNIHVCMCVNMYCNCVYISIEIEHVHTKTSMYK